jgi:uncharacterized repeat protein (TIGR03803 family)
MRSNHSFLAWLRSFAILALALASATTAWAGPKYKVLHNFSGPDGGGLFGGLVLDKKGDLYGNAFGGGGQYNGGVVFELSPSSGGDWTESTLYAFCTQSHYCPDGAGPEGALTFDRSGNLYGSAGFGGSNNLGVVFDLTPGSGGWTYSALYESGSDAGWIFDNAGNLYGFTGPGTYHAGAVAELSPGSDGWTYTALYSFDPQKKDGYISENALIFDSSGNLYGTAKDGGPLGGGTVFEVSPLKSSLAGEWTEHILYAFPAFQGDGQQPYAGVVFDRAGNLYGTTESGGTVNQTCPQGCGTIYKLTPDGQGGWKETILHRFPKFEGGFSPLGTLTFDKSGNIYGTTAGGGAGGNTCFGGCGTVFKLTPGQDGKWKYTVLHRFAGPDGAGPEAGLTLDKKGNIYGTTTQGGSGYVGVVFEITP